MNASAVIRIAVTGVESTGKTTLTEALSARLLDGRAGMRALRWSLVLRATLATLERLAQAQADACEAAVQQAAATGAECVVSDTDALVLKLWGEHAFDQTPAGLERLQAWPDLILLCVPTIPWEADPLRSMPRLEDRVALHAAYAQAVAALPAYAIIDATMHEKRLDQAVRAFQNFGQPRLADDELHRNGVLNTCRLAALSPGSKVGLSTTRIASASKRESTSRKTRTFQSCRLSDDEVDEHGALNPHPWQSVGTWCSWKRT